MTYPSSLDDIPSVTPGEIIASAGTNVQINGINQLEATVGISSQWNSFASLHAWVAACALITQVQYQACTYAADTGTTNAYEAALSPAPAAYAVGLTLTFTAANASTGACTLNVNSLGAKALLRNGGTAIQSGDIAVGQNVTCTFDGISFQLVSPVNSGSQATLNLFSSTNEFRLTKFSGVPIPPDQQDTDFTPDYLYLTPYTGSRIALYNGTNWQVYTTGEMSLSISAIYTGDDQYDLWDVFVYSDDGTPTLELGPMWTNATTRSTALSLQDDVWVKSTDATRRYVGTFMKDNEDGVGDMPGFRYIYSAANRVPRLINAGWDDIVTTNSSTWSFLAWATPYVLGLINESVMGTGTSWAVGGSGAAAEIALGVLNDPVAVTGTPEYWAAMAATTGSDWLTAVYCKRPDTIGYQNMQLYCRSNTDETTVSFGGEAEGGDDEYLYTNVIGFAWM